MAAFYEHCSWQLLLAWSPLSGNVDFPSFIHIVSSPSKIDKIEQDSPFVPLFLEIIARSTLCLSNPSHVTPERSSVLKSTRFPLIFVFLSHFQHREDNQNGRSSPLKFSAVQRARRGVKKDVWNPWKKREPWTPSVYKWALWKRKNSGLPGMQNHMHTLIKGMWRRRRGSEKITKLQCMRAMIFHSVSLQLCPCNRGSNQSAGY